MNVDITKLENATVKTFNQNTLKKGDILLTSASETPDECAMSSVIRQDIQENVYLDDHLFAIRLKDSYKDIINTAYVNYYMHTSEFRIQVCRKVRGVTRFYITGKPFMSLEIPVPPIEVQSKIVEILDNFTELEAELEAELKARQKQYEYYRNQLLTFDKVGGARFERLGAVILSLKTGLNPRKNFVLNSEDSNKPYITGKDIFANRINVTDKTDMINDYAVNLINKRACLESGLLLFASTGTGTVGRMAIIENYNNDWAMSETLYAIKTKENLSSKYLMHFLYSDNAKKQFEPKISKGSVPHLKVADLLNVDVPIPPLEEQKKIVSILDRFEALTTDLQSGLPAEIEARRKQYEYYREQLLTFKRKTA